jgi:hypothetical protein
LEKHYIEYEKLRGPLETWKDNRTSRTK